MKCPAFYSNWPESWKMSWQYDQKEVFGNGDDYAYSYGYQLRYHKTIELVKKTVPFGGTILDVAAAQGNFSLTFAEAGYKVTWNDIRSNLVDYVRLKHEYGDINYMPGNIFEIDFNMLFDAVIITEVIEHVAHPDKFLKRIAELVKPAGKIILSTPNGNKIFNKLPKFSDCKDPSQFEYKQFQPDGDGHIFLLCQQEIYELAKFAELKVLQLIYLETPIVKFNVKLKKIIPFIPTINNKFIDYINKTIRNIPYLNHKLNLQIVCLLEKA